MDVERVLLAEPRGFCAGVEMAIKALAWMVRSFEAPVYCYHEIVHNKVIVERFERQGVVFVDDIDEVPPGRPIMLSAHGSAPEVVAAARSWGSYVVDSVCPLVTKVHHEVRVRAGKGYRIVYVGHEGHEEAVGHDGGRSDVDQQGRVGQRRRGAAGVRTARRPARPDDAVASRSGRRRGRCPRALSRRMDAGAQRPVLRDHQPPIGADGAGGSVRRGDRDRVGQFVEHPGPGEARPRSRLCAGGADQLGRRDTGRPARPRPGRRRDGRGVGAERAGREVIARLAPSTGSSSSG